MRLPAECRFYTPNRIQNFYTVCILQYSQMLVKGRILGSVAKKSDVLVFMSRDLPQ